MRLGRWVGACGIVLWSISLAMAAEQPTKVFVSIAPQAWLVQELAGTRVEVQVLLASGANPHTFEPTAPQLRQMAHSALYLTMGMPFERPLVSRVQQLNPQLTVAAMDAGVAKIDGHAHDEHPAHAGCDGDGDPHIWLSPRLMCSMASNSVEALEKVLPQAAPELQEALQRVIRQTQALDRELHQKLATLKTRHWVVYHPSWSYFARDYNLELLAIEEDGKVPSARHLARVARQARSAGVTKIFAEPQYDQRPVTTLARQLQVRVALLDPLAADWVALMREVATQLAD